MNKRSLVMLVLMVLLVTAAQVAEAQCSICTRTAQQLGERPAKALNTGIIYLAAAPFLIFSYIGYRWWRNNRGEE